MKYDDTPYQTPPGWTFLTGDVGWEKYGGKWCRKAPDGTWWIVRFENCDEWGDGAHGFEADIQRIDLAEVPPTELGSALRSCGWEIEARTGNIVCPHSGDVVAEFDTDAWPMVLIDCLSGSGCYSPMGSVTAEGELDDFDCTITDDGTAHKTRDSAFTEAEEMMGSPEAIETALNKPVNALGATARDFGRGDPMAPLRAKADAMLRGENVLLSTSESIILKMYSASNGQTLGGTVKANLAAAGRIVSKEKADDE